MPKCIIEECENKAIYGKITDYKKIYCINHKNNETNLIDICYHNSIYCCKCNIQYGSYYKENKKEEKYCYTCKMKEMIELNNMIII